MIPVRDVIPARRVPIVTIALIAVGLLVHAAGLLRGMVLDVWPDRLIPSDGASPTLLLLGLLRYDGWLPLAVGLLYLWLFGENVEDRLGRGRFALFYAACGLVAGTAASALPPPWTSPPTATGAVSGVLGAYAVLFPRARILVLVPLPVGLDLIEVPIVHLMLAWFFVQLALALGTPAPVPAISVTGFLTGAGLVTLLGVRRRQSEYWQS
jgi:membrane associated rhomboid family serine protease